MDAQPTRYRSPLATLLAFVGLLAAPGGLRAELLVNAPPCEGPPPGVRPWAPAGAAATRSRREEADEEDAPAPAGGVARPLLALMLGLAIPPTMAASDVVSASDTTEKLDKVPTLGTNGGSIDTGSGGTTGGGTTGGGTPNTPATPEPASLISGLVGIGVAAAAALARRRRAARRVATA
jgi:hypothetical protein